MSIQTPSTKNTKQEILKAYEELVKELKQGNLVEQAPAKLAKAQQDFDQLQEQMEQQITVINQSAISSLNQLGKTLKEASAQITAKLKDTAQTIGQSLEAQQALQENFQLEQVRLKKQNQQQQDDYEYDYTKRKQRQEQELREMQAAKEKDWKQREEELKARDDEYKDLKNQVANFEARLAKSIKESVDSSIKEIEVSHNHKLQIISQQGESQLQLLKQQVESAKQTIMLQQKEIERLQKEVTSANIQLTRIAERAVEKAPTHTIKSATE